MTDERRSVELSQKDIETLQRLLRQSETLNQMVIQWERKKWLKENARDSLKWLPQLFSVVGTLITVIMTILIFFMTNFLDGLP